MVKERNKNWLAALKFGCIINFPIQKLQKIMKSNFDCQNFRSLCLSGFIVMNDSVVLANLIAN